MIQPTTPAAIDRLPDQREYLILGRNLLHYRSLCFYDARFGQTVWAYRMPGYPVFVAACGGSTQVVRFAQSIIDVSTLLAVFLIARKLCNTATGLIAASLMAINPFYIYFTGLILSETLFSALIIWAIWFLICRKWVVMMVLLTAGCYVKPTGLLFVPLLLLVGSPNYTTPTAYRLSDGLLRSAAATLILLACLFPWAIRNHQILRVWIWTTTNSGMTLYDGFNPAATGGSNQQFLTEHPQLRSINEADRSLFFTVSAKRWITENWTAIPALSVRKILRGWSPVPLSQDFGRPVYRWISAAYNIPFDLLCLVGLFSSRLTRTAKVLVVMPALIVTLAQVMSVGSIRYRMPAEAPLAVVASVGILELLGRRPKFE